MEATLNETGGEDGEWGYGTMTSAKPTPPPTNPKKRAAHDEPFFTYVILQIIEEDPHDTRYLVAEYAAIQPLVAKLFDSVPSDRITHCGFFEGDAYDEHGEYDTKVWSPLKRARVLEFQQRYQCLVLPAFGYQ